jgi:hypothetical protein
VLYCGGRVKLHKILSFIAFVCIIENHFIRQF